MVIRSFAPHAHGGDAGEVLSQVSRCDCAEGTLYRMTDVDVYPTGLIADYRHRRLRSGFRYVFSKLRERNFRAVRSYLRGWRAEHSYYCTHNAGAGFTQRGALRQVERLCAEAHAPGQDFFLEG